MDPNSIKNYNSVLNKVAFPQDYTANNYIYPMKELYFQRKDRCTQKS